MPESITMLLVYGGWGLILIGGLMFLFAAFSEGILWGLGCLFLPFVSLVFLIVHWRRAKTAFLVELIGWGMFLLAAVLGARS